MLSQEVKLGPCIIPDEPVGKNVLEQVACIKDPDGYIFEVGAVRVGTALSPALSLGIPIPSIGLLVLYLLLSIVYCLLGFFLGVSRVIVIR